LDCSAQHFELLASNVLSQVSEQERISERAEQEAFWARLNVPS